MPLFQGTLSYTLFFYKNQVFSYQKIKKNDTAITTGIIFKICY